VGDADAIESDIGWLSLFPPLAHDAKLNARETAANTSIDLRQKPLTPKNLERSDTMVTLFQPSPGHSPLVPMNYERKHLLRAHSGFAIHAIFNSFSLTRKACIGKLHPITKANSKRVAKAGRADPDQGVIRPQVCSNCRDTPSRIIQVSTPVI
jgi:hypothetical protein